MDANMLSTIGMMLLIFVLGYFLMVRPMKKRAAQMQEMAASIQPGNRVLLTSGVFATVKHVGDSQMVVEIAPDVEVTIMKNAVVKVVTSADEEFEYEDVATGAPVVADAEPVFDPYERPADAEPMAAQAFIPPSDSGVAPIVPPSDPAEVRPAGSTVADDSALLPSDDEADKREVR